MGSEILAFWGEGVNGLWPSTGEWRGRAERGSRGQGKFVLPTLTAGIRRTELLPLCAASLPLENLTACAVVAHSAASGLKCSWKEDVLLLLCVPRNCVGEKMSIIQKKKKAYKKTRK